MLEMAKKLSFYSKGLRFSCVRCSACCRHDSGYVFLSGKDASVLITALKMEYKDFVKAYCRWIPSVNGTEQLSLREKSNFDCIFWEQKPESGCSVYAARPLQCRSFPFWTSVVLDKSSWDFAASECPGMGKGTLHSGESIEKWLAMRQKEPIISRSTKNKGEA